MGEEGEKPGDQEFIPEHSMLAASSLGLACWDYHITARACAKARNNTTLIPFIPSMVSQSHRAHRAASLTALRTLDLQKGLVFGNGKVTEMQEASMPQVREAMLLG